MECEQTVRMFCQRNVVLQMGIDNHHYFCKLLRSDQGRFVVFRMAATVRLLPSSFRGRRCLTFCLVTSTYYWNLG